MHKYFNNNQDIFVYLYHKGGIIYIDKIYDTIKKGDKNAKILCYYI